VSSCSVRIAYLEDGNFKVYLTPQLKWGCWRVFQRCWKGHEKIEEREGGHLAQPLINRADSEEWSHASEATIRREAEVSQWAYQISQYRVGCESVEKSLLYFSLFHIEPNFISYKKKILL
jgi:hypothetical protein